MLVIFVASHIWERPAKIAMGLRMMGHEVHLVTRIDRLESSIFRNFNSVLTGIENPIPSLSNFPSSAVIHHFSTAVDQYTVYLLLAKRPFIFDYKDVFPGILTLPSDGQDSVLQAIVAQEIPVCHRDGQFAAYMERRGLQESDKLHFVPDFTWPNQCPEIGALVLPATERRRKIVFIGNFSIEALEPKFAGFGQLEIIHALVSQNLSYTMYPFRHDRADLNQKLMADYHQMAEKFSNFSLSNRVSRSMLAERLRTHGWGSLLLPACHFDELRDAHYAIRPFTGLAARFSDYLSAGLPIMVSAENLEASDWIESYGIGLSINRAALSSISKMIDDCDYVRLRRNVIDFTRDFLDWRKCCGKIISVYNEYF